MKRRRREQRRAGVNRRMRSEPEPAFKVERYGSTIEWNADGVRVTPPSDDNSPTSVPDDFFIENPR